MSRSPAPFTAHTVVRSALFPSAHAPRPRRPFPLPWAGRGPARGGDVEEAGAGRRATLSTPIGRLPALPATDWLEPSRALGGGAWPRMRPGAGGGLLWPPFSVALLGNPRGAAAGPPAPARPGPARGRGRAPLPPPHLPPPSSGPSPLPQSRAGPSRGSSRGSLLCGGGAGAAVGPVVSL